MTTKDYIRHKAVLYLKYKDNFEELTKKQISNFRGEVETAYDKIPHSKVQVMSVDGQPYVDHIQLSNDIKLNGTLRISSDHNESVLLPGLLNLQFRAVHDYLHYTLQQPFTAVGEINVFKMQRKFHSTGISQQILFSEVVLQACYAEYFGKFPPTQKVVLYKGRI